jgi:hypothetical protein
MWMLVGAASIPGMLGEMAISQQLFSDLRTGKPKLNLPQLKVREPSN